MAPRSALTIEHDLEETRNAYNIVRSAIIEAKDKGADRIEKLPAFLYIEFALRWTAYQELLVEYEKAKTHKNVCLRHPRLWSWLQALPDETSEYESAVEEGGE